jgi:CheY-like chemotaxis protein
MSEDAVLNVNDDDSDVFLMERAWKEAVLPNALHIVRDGQEAIDYLSGTAQFADRTAYPIPAFVLLDLKLPKMHGLKLLNWISEHPATQALSVVILSSSTTDRDIKASRTLGITDYWVKSGERRVLVRMLARLKESLL